MWKYISSFFYKDSVSAEGPLDLEDAYTVLKECEVETPIIEEETVEEPSQYEVVNKVGKVTKIEENIYTVDDLYDFQSDLRDVGIGTKISYQLIKNGDELKVVGVEVLENDWNVVSVGKALWHERILVASVIKRDGRVVTLNPGGFTINLNNVCSEFIPVVGDWVEVEVKCENDESVVDCSGRIIEINQLRPVRPQIKLGKVTDWDVDRYTGVIDRNIFFKADALYCGYVPQKGDKVVAEIIESNQGSCTWRALRIVPDHLHSKSKDTINEDKIKDFLASSDSVEITDDINLMFTKLGEMRIFLVEIKAKIDIQLVNVELPRINGQCQYKECLDHYDLKANSDLTIRVECQAKCVGESRELLIFHFDKFKIGRWVSINVASYQPDKVRTKNTPRRQVVSRSKREIIRGQGHHASVRFIALRIPDYTVPERLLNLLIKHRQDNTQHTTLKIELERMKPCLLTSLNYMNFEDKFHTLLHLDEIHTLLEMQNYDQERACFVKSGEYLVLEIDNLAERRPSVIVGDRVVARDTQDSKKPDYEGFIHKIGKNHVFIKFARIFHDAYDGEDYAIFILASRITYKRKHFAVNLAVRNLGREWLFPSKIVEKEPQLEFVVDEYVDCLGAELSNGQIIETSPSSARQRLLDKIQKFNENSEEKTESRKLDWHNRSLNYFQKEAVRNILLGVCRPLPYIIFGPPGTGKTVTIVETVLQILRLIPHSRILLCAPSNSAADLLALRLIESGVVKPGDLIRLVAANAIPGIPAKLAPYCATANLEKEGTETLTPVVTPSGLVLGYSSSVLGRHRITVSTCSSAGLLYSMGFSKGHFSHIIVDEAGQTSEPGVLVPLAFLDVSNGQAILAGDPMQLGPVVLSHLADDYGFGESFLERMISRFPYVRDSEGFPKSCGYDPRLITKLVYNYRSLPELLKLPSVLFYNDDLRPTISDSDSKEAKILHQLEDMLPKTKNGKIPSLVFHGVFGQNFQTEDSPSWFNPNEASQVFYYVNELYRLGLKCEDVGIITPYKAQAKQLMELLQEANFAFPKVGTVEEFQGQEFNVVILSTVRSNKRFLASDAKFAMGFIANPRRLNVAITRAKVLLIVVGNPDLLSGDRCWRSVIKYAREKGSFI